jgi:hypothetical protein
MLAIVYEGREYLVEGFKFERINLKETENLLCSRRYPGCKYKYHW